MTEPETGDGAPSDRLFADLPAAAESHFKIHFFAAVLGVIEQASAESGSFEAARQRFPFLAGYGNELARRVNGLSSTEAWQRWQASRSVWEKNVTAHLPLRTLAVTLGLEPATVACLVTIGMVEEDARFGGIFDAFQGGGIRRPTLGFLRQCWQPFAPITDLSGALRRLHEAGFVHVLNPEAPRPEWVAQIPPPVWDALRGLPPSTVGDWLRIRPVADLPRLDELVLPAELRRTVEAVPELLATGQLPAIVVRGPARNGRHTLLGALARTVDHCVVEYRGRGAIDPARWGQACGLALVQRGWVVWEPEVDPGETVHVPESPAPGVPLGIVMGRHGGWEGRLAAQAVTIEMEPPSLAQRERLWARFLPGQSNTAEFAGCFRLTSGAIADVARSSRVQAALAGSSGVTLAEVQHGARTLRRRALETLAQPLPSAGDLGRLRAGERTWRELEHLERRCRHRERLPDAFDPSPGGAGRCGVRALFHGPSGTGKTLAARLLAATLHKDLYRLDLSAVINKYIGETEKNLNRVFDLAEELDVILLLDEGDALLTRRTDVQTANDRYANLETNFLLQRLETFDGIVFITTNTRDRIDRAFERRLDVLVEFLAPDATERWQLWQDHLPPAGDLDEQTLGVLAGSCELTGGQIRNAALHASLLALDNGGVVTTAYIAAAVRREYAKLGAVCPLRI